MVNVWDLFVHLWFKNTAALFFGRAACGAFWDNLETIAEFLQDRFSKSF